MATEREIAAAKHAFMDNTGATAEAADQFLPMIVAILDAAENARNGRFGLKADTGYLKGMLGSMGG